MLRFNSFYPSFPRFAVIVPLEGIIIIIMMGNYSGPCSSQDTVLPLLLFNQHNPFCCSSNVFMKHPQHLILILLLLLLGIRLRSLLVHCYALLLMWKLLYVIILWRVQFNFLCTQTKVCLCKGGRAFS